MTVFDERVMRVLFVLVHLLLPLNMLYHCWGRRTDAKVERMCESMAIQRTTHALNGWPRSAFNQLINHTLRNSTSKKASEHTERSICCVFKVWILGRIWR